LVPNSGFFPPQGGIAAGEFEDLPADVVALGKKSILDGIGLALSGVVARSAMRR